MSTKSIIGCQRHSPVGTQKFSLLTIDHDAGALRKKNQEEQEEQEHNK
jgi:hypothetical protein